MKKNKIHHNYNLNRDKPDARDHLYHQKYGLTATVALPTSVDLRPKFPAVYDQGSLNSCTGNALVAALQYEHIKDSANPVMLSRLFVYYNERALENQTGVDEGAFLRDGIKSLSTQGVCAESVWPYLSEAVKTKPSAAAYTQALSYKISNYSRLVDLQSIQSCLASGYPVVFGMTCFNEFEGAVVAKTGIAPMPTAGEEPIGAHAVVAVGYDAVKKVMIVRNSWGAAWGQNGYFMLPFGFFTNTDLATDFWTIRK